MSEVPLCGQLILYGERISIELMTSDRTLDMSADPAWARLGGGLYMSWPLGYFGYDPSRKGTGKVAIHHTEWDRVPWPTMAFSHLRRPERVRDEGSARPKILDDARCTTYGPGPCPYRGTSL